jgi:hypothetical protein
MGYAHGALMNEPAQQFYNASGRTLRSNWFVMSRPPPRASPCVQEEAIDGTVNFLRPWFADLVSELAYVPWLVLRRTEARQTGGCAGLGDHPDLSLLWRVLRYSRCHWLPSMSSVELCVCFDQGRRRSLTKGGCSMYGAWSDAVANTNSKLMQLRALDWDVDGPFKV